MSLLANAKWKIPIILKKGKEHFMCYAFVDVTGLVAGADIRRCGVKGKKKWALQWEEGAGFDSDENFMRVYIDITKVHVLEELIKAHQARYTQYDLNPDENIGFLDISILFVAMYVIDGMHRTITLVARHWRWVKENSDQDPRSSPYLRVRVMIYNPSVCFMMAVLAKASNDSKQLHVQEDGLERVTVTQKVVASFRLHDKTSGGKKVSETDMARYLMEQAGCNKSTAVNYHAQLVGMAVALEGEATKWLSATIDALEDADTARATVKCSIVSRCSNLFFFQ
jgi:hypothetical protein